MIDWHLTHFNMIVRYYGVAANIYNIGVGFASTSDMVVRVI